MEGAKEHAAHSMKGWKMAKTPDRSLGSVIHHSTQWSRDHPSSQSEATLAEDWICLFHTEARCRARKALYATGGGQLDAAAGAFCFFIFSSLHPGPDKIRAVTGQHPNLEEDSESADNDIRSSVILAECCVSS